MTIAKRAGLALLMIAIAVPVAVSMRSARDVPTSTPAPSSRPDADIDEIDPNEPIAIKTMPTAELMKADARSFGPKGAWIAAKGASTEKVARALRLLTPVKVWWVEGLRRSYDPNGPMPKTYPSLLAAMEAEKAYPISREVFVTPPIRGWTLAVSQRLAFFRSFAFKNVPEDRAPEKLLPFLESLSRELDGVVQYFFTHRVPEIHIWVWADRGRIVRARGYSGERGEMFLRTGAMTPGERDAGAAEDRADEDDVLAVAAKWSVDPSRLDELEDVRWDDGVVGEMP